jgi:hypothetical protein
MSTQSSKLDRTSLESAVAAPRERIGVASMLLGLRLDRPGAQDRAKQESRVVLVSVFCDQAARRNTSTFRTASQRPVHLRLRLDLRFAAADCVNAPSM